MESIVKKDFMDTLGIDKNVMFKVSKYWYNDEEEVSKLEYFGKKLSERILQHNDEFGGVYVEVTGAQGAGKTSVMLSWMEYILLHYPDEKIFWSSSYDAPLQFLKFVEKDEDFEKIHIMVKEGSDVIFRDRKAKGRVLDLNITYFTDFEDLYEKARPGKCNAVFFGNRYTWMDFIHYL